MADPEFEMKLPQFGERKRDRMTELEDGLAKMGLLTAMKAKVVCEQAPESEECRKLEEYEDRIVDALIELIKHEEEIRKKGK